MKTAPQPRQAPVQQEGVARTLPPSGLHCGDRIVLTSGDVVPADCRILACYNLRIQEADLTGESEPADKRPDTSGREGLSWCDPCAMAFMGTRVVAGAGLAEVVATGAQTRWAQIAALSQVVPRMPPPRRYREIEQIMPTLLLALVGLLLLLGLLHILQTLVLAGQRRRQSSAPEHSPTRAAAPIDRYARDRSAAHNMALSGPPRWVNPG